MIVKRGVTHRINQGNYEHVEIRGEVEINDSEFLGTPAESVIEEAQRILDKLIKPDLERARRVFPEDLEFTSYITEWGDQK